MNHRIARRGLFAHTLLLLSACTASPSSALEISTLGTSITAGNRWQPVVQESLERCGMGPVRVVNYGKAGQSIAWGVQNALPAVEGKPDVLVVEFAINDAAVDRGLPLADSERLTRQLISSVKSASPGTRIYLMITNDPIGDPAAKRPQLPQYYDMYRRLARQERVGLIDTQAHWRPHGASALRDGLHPTNKAYANVLAPAVVAALAPSCSR
jgi:acyl-CoA thioesterase I